MLWFRLVAAGAVVAAVEVLAGSRPPEPTHVSMALLVAAGAVAASSLARSRSTLGSMFAAFGLTVVTAVAIFLGVLATAFAGYLGWSPFLMLVVLVCVATCAAAVVLWAGSPRTWERSRAQRADRDGGPPHPIAVARAQDPRMNVER